MSRGPDQGALVISLDLEAHWGVRHRVRPGDPYYRNLLAERDAVDGILRLFQEYGIHATWAVVGFLFAGNRRDLETHRPSVLPTYDDPRLDPYSEAVGADESDDPLHYAPSVIRDIARVPGQEIGTHTFSHYFCNEPGQRMEAFRSDLRSAVSIAKEHGHAPSSMVFPRNQVNAAYLPLLVDAGLQTYRGIPRPWMYRETRWQEGLTPARLARYADSHVPLAGSHTFRWSEVAEPGGLYNVPASFFLRPCGPRRTAGTTLHLRRLRKALEVASARKELVHLWWHPHNFGAQLDANLSVLREILDSFERLRDREGMASLSMRDVAQVLHA